jgi:hypothetical protein
LPEEPSVTVLFNFGTTTDLVNGNFGIGLFRLSHSLVNLIAFPSDGQLHCEPLLSHNSPVVFPLGLSAPSRRRAVAVSSSARCPVSWTSTSLSTDNSRILSLGPRLAALAYAADDSRHCLAGRNLCRRTEVALSIAGKGEKAVKRAEILGHFGCSMRPSRIRTTNVAH